MMKGTPVILCGAGWDSEDTGFGEFYDKETAELMKQTFERRGAYGCYIRKRGNKGYTLFIPEEVIE